MRIVLVNPPLKLPKSWGVPSVSQNLGLMYVASALRSQGHGVKVIDAVGENWKQIVETEDSYYCGMGFKDIIKAASTFDPQVVGISSTFTVNAQTVKNLILDLKQEMPTVKVMVGGPDVTVRPREYDMTDYIVLGEAEDTMKDFAYTHVHFQKFTENLDELAFPARDLFPMQEYFKAYDQGRACRNKYVADRRWTTMVTTRGCPYNCVFCSVHLSMGRKLRKRSIENVEAEINELVKGKLRIKHINFEDDNISLDQAFFRNFLEMLGQYDVSWSLPNGIRADTLNEETVRAMSRTGCSRLFVAPEVGVQRVLTEIVHKNMQLSAVEKAVKLFVRYGIKVDATFIIGFIGETKKDIVDTIRYACKLKRLGVDGTAISIAAPLYGTELYQQAVAGGYISEDFDLSQMSPFESVISTEQFSSDWILWARDFSKWYVNLQDWFKPLSTAKMLLVNPRQAYSFCRFWTRYILPKILR